MLLGLENRVFPFTNEIVLTGVEVGSGIIILLGTIFKVIEPEEEWRKIFPSVLVEILGSNFSENYQEYLG